MSHAEEVGGKKAKTLQEEKEIALISQELVTINTSVDFEKSLSFFMPKEPDNEAHNTGRLYKAGL